jgi:hypothetical protein
MIFPLEFKAATEAEAFARAFAGAVITGEHTRRSGVRGVEELWLLSKDLMANVVPTQREANHNNAHHTGKQS